jgi:hypothetical protein
MTQSINDYLEQLELISIYHSPSPYLVNVSAKNGDNVIVVGLRIDWNHRQTVGHFAAFANQVIRAGGAVTTEAVK